MIDGSPNESFPPELCTTVDEYVDKDGFVKRQRVITEPLAANIATDGEGPSLRKLKTEFFRIAAPLVGCSYSDLYSREKKRRIKIISVCTIALFGLGVVVGCIAGRIKTASTDKFTNAPTAVPESYVPASSTASAAPTPTLDASAAPKVSETPAASAIAAAGESDKPADAKNSIAASKKQPKKLQKP